MNQIYNFNLKLNYFSGFVAEQLNILNFKSTHQVEAINYFQFEK